MGESEPSLEAVHRIRHHLAHALMGLVSLETEARGRWKIVGSMS
jgi:hypothetical protein